MSNARITGLRSIELGVRDLNASAAFYSRVWGLEEVSSEADTIHLRGTGTEHHTVTLRQRPQSGLLGVHFAATDRNTVDALHARLKGYGVAVADKPIELPRVAGGGYGFQFRSPEGHVLNVSADVARHPDVGNDRSRPIKLSHVVLNSVGIDETTEFFLDGLGFRVSDKTHMMHFVRCSADHHSIALARAQGPGLNHMAYEMENIDGLMRGAGRMKQSGFNVEWGVGRHGPGDNVFSYFIEPNGLVVEYTTEIQQIDEAEYVPQTPEYWAAFPMRPCRWGMATTASNRLRAAMAGKLVDVAEEDRDVRCEEVMAKTLGR
jgi:catechol 2,3-dioxygenase-like lactoylglutathione lyase family enzyme